MTNQQKAPQGQNGQYKQVYFSEYPATPYTETTMNYDDYRHTEVWKKLRNKRKRMDNYRCQKCGTGINIEVHHMRYPDVWGMESVEDDLVTLCATCHALVHQTDIVEGK